MLMTLETVKEIRLKKDKPIINCGERRYEIMPRRYYLDGETIISSARMVGSEQSRSADERHKTRELMSQSEPLYGSERSKNECRNEESLRIPPGRSAWNFASDGVVRHGDALMPREYEGSDAMRVYKFEDIMLRSDKRKLDKDDIVAVTPTEASGDSPFRIEAGDREVAYYEKVMPLFMPSFGINSSDGRVLIYGGNGYVGDDVVQHFSKNNWWIVSVDLSHNEEANFNILLRSKDSCEDQRDTLDVQLKECMGVHKFDSIICMASGWCGGNAASDDLMRCHQFCWNSNVCPAIITASIATKYLKDNGLLIFRGDTNALAGCPDMIGYSLCMAAIHNLVMSLAPPKSGLPADAVVLAVLISRIDTPRNRKDFPTADYSNWTPVNFLTSKIYEWSCKKDVPKSGSLLMFETKKCETIILPHRSVV